MVAGTYIFLSFGLPLILMPGNVWPLAPRTKRRCERLPFKGGAACGLGLRSFDTEDFPMNPYNSLCDDFGVYVYLNTKMPLPSSRETILHFFEGLRKTYPTMTDFDARESGEFVLEEDREQGSYRWVTVEAKRLCAGYVNPPD